MYRIEIKKPWKWLTAKINCSYFFIILAGGKLKVIIPVLLWFISLVNKYKKKEQK